MRLFLVNIFILIFLSNYANCAKQPVVAKKTKLCADPDCNEVLFKSKATRDMPSSHPLFISLVPGMVLDVVGIKFSDRLDIMEAVTTEGKRGSFYNTGIDRGGYVEFLRDAVANKKTMYLISQDPNDIGDKRIVGTLQAEKELVRDYNVQARNYASDQGLPAPEELPIPTPESSGHGHSHGGHGHSHDGHGHSHGGHGHSHDDNHGHAHSQPEVKPETAAPVVPEVAANPVPSVEATTPTPVTLPPIVHHTTPPPPVAVPPPQAVPVVPETATPVPVAVTQPPPQQEPPVAAQPVPAVPVETTQQVQQTLEPTPVTEEVPRPVENAAAEPPMQKVKLEDMDAEIERLIKEEEDKKVAEMLDAEMQMLKNSAPSPVPTLNTADIIGSALPPKLPTHETVPEDPVQAEIPTTTPAPVVEEVTMPPLEPVVHATTEAPVIPPPEVHPTHHHINAHVHPPHGSEEVTTTAAPVVEEVPPVVPEDPKPTIAEEGFCHSDDCEKFENQQPIPVEEIHNVPVHVITNTAAPEIKEDPFKAAPFDDNFPAAGHSDFVEDPFRGETPPAKPSMIGSIFHSVANVVRSILGMNDLSDAGVGFVLNITFVVVMLSFHLIGKLLSDGDDSHKDARLSHDLVTRCRQLQEELNQKNADLQRLNASAGRSQADAQEINTLRNELSSTQHELQQYTTRLEQATADLQREQREREAYENSQAEIREKMNEAEIRAREAERHLGECQLALDAAKRDFTSTKSALDRFESDLHNERHKTEEYEASIAEYRETIDRLQDDITEKDSRIVDLDEKNRGLTAEIEQLSKMLESQIAKPQEESNGGSSGWSDFGDDVTEEATSTIAEDKKKTAPTTEAVDLREVAKARAQMAKLESDFNKAKEDFTRQLEDNKRLTESVDKLKAELLTKTKEYEKTHAALMQALDVNNTHVQKNYDNEKAVRALHDDINKLKDEIASWKDQLAAVREEKRSKEERIKEVENELKLERARAERLEAKNFHDSRELKRQIELAKTQVIQQPPATSYDPLNMSSGSIERGTAPSRGPPVMPDLQSIWDEPSVPSGLGRRTMSPMSPDDDFFAGPAITPVVKSKSRSSRKSDRVHRDASPSDAEKRKEKKDGVARRRSRSHGRQTYMGDMGPMPPYMQGGPGYNPMYENHMYDPRVMGSSFDHTRRLSRSGQQLYYSSGGSNGGRSPPPEMPLISAVPPPGAQRPRSKRGSDMPSNFK